jgi:hypothetical protein
MRLITAPLILVSNAAAAAADARVAAASSLKS